MDYEKTVPCTGDIEKAIEAARNVFIQHTFQIVNQSENAVELAGPGMLSSRQDPLVGISRIRIFQSSGGLSVEAQFDSIRKLIKYIAVFIVVMGVFFVVLFAVLFARQGQPLGIIVLISLAPLAPWPVLLPLIMIWLKSRTSRALDVLLSNIAYLARQESST
ncbi:MAG: hypothetical protein ACYTEQ_12860 [Planctomycetota bacterium]|jgi:hypothetical protein